MSESNHAAKLVDLLKQSLTVGNLSGVDEKAEAYIQSSRRYLMTQLLSLSPDMVEFENGESVLVEVFRASPASALDWVALRGPRAWAPTTRSPLPLVDVIHALKPISCLGSKHPLFTWPRQMLERLQEVKQFVQEGFKEALPLREDAPASLVNSEVLFGQRTVVEFCSQPCSLFQAQEKMRWLKSAGGALVASRAQVSPWIQENLVSPDEVAWVEADGRPKASQAGHVRKTPIQAWLDDPSLPDPKATLDWLATHQVPAAEVNRVHGRLLKQAVDQCLTWSHIEQAANQMDGGWTYQDASGNGLLWQTALARRPHFLVALLRAPNATQLVRLRSTQGLGVWDFLAASSAAAKDWPGLNEILELEKRVPLELSPSLTPLAFRTSPLPPWWAAWFDESFQRSPQAWLGPKSEQAIRAAQLWKGLLVGEGVSNAAQREIMAAQLALLHRAWAKAPQHVSAEVPSVLLGVQKYLEAAPLSLKQDLTVLMGDDSIPDPAPDTVGWVSAMEDQLGKSGGKGSPSRRALDDILKWIRLHALPAAPRKSGPRF